MNWKITKREKLLSVRNEWCAVDYWLIHGRIYTDDGTAYQPFKFIEWIDYGWYGEQLEDYMPMTDKEILEEQISGFCSGRLFGPFSHDKVKLFLDDCNDTIRNFYKT